MRLLTLPSLLAALLLPATASAAIAVFPVSATNLDDGEREAVGVMLGTAYQTETGEAVLLPQQTGPVMEQLGDPGQAAAQLGAGEYVLVRAVRLKRKIVITATRYSADGKVIHTGKLTATSLDDLEAVSERLARSLTGKVAAEETQTIDNVTETEGKRPNRIFVEKVMGIKAGFVYPLGYGTEIAPMMSFGFDGRLEGKSYFLEIGAGFAIPSGESDKEKYGGLYADLGANYYLTHTSVSPYVGIGVMPRLMSTNVTNFAAYGQLGAMFMRESSSRIYTDVRIAQNLLPVGFSDYSTYDSETGSFVEEDKDLYPTELTLHVGIGW